VDPNPGKSRKKHPVALAPLHKIHLQCEKLFTNKSPSSFQTFFVKNRHPDEVEGAFSCGMSFLDFLFLYSAGHFSLEIVAPNVTTHFFSF
jgi:hypothetical protein